MRRVFLLGVFLTCVASAAAQTEGKSYANGCTAKMDAQGRVSVSDCSGGAAAEVPACPVQMHAQQGDSSEIRWANKLPATSGQRIRLVLSQGRAGQVASAVVTARGLSGKNRTVQTLSTEGVTPDRTQTLEAKFAFDRETGAYADLFLSGFTAVLSVRLDSITYRDGSTWKADGSQLCRVAPDMLVRVAAR